MGRKKNRHKSKKKYQQKTLFEIFPIEIPHEEIKEVFLKSSENVGFDFSDSKGHSKDKIQEIEDILEINREYDERIKHKWIGG